MKFLLLTLGCKVNSYESDAVRELLLLENYLEAKKNEVPDIVVINTCTVTHVAAKKSRQQLRKYRNIYPEAILVVMGCFVQEEQEQVLDIVDANIILGTNRRRFIVQYIKDFIAKENKTIIDLRENPFLFPYEEIATLKTPSATRAFVKIQDGCNNFCAYCIIPYVRGQSRSRKEDEVVKEVKTLVNNGYLEIVLTGINLGLYGQDFDDQSNLYGLLKRILKEVPQIYSLRLSSIESNTISNDLIDLFVKDQRLARHLHIPLQSGSNELLRKMNRRYTKEEYFKLVQKIKKQIPGIAITTDIIVGFPFEEEKHFIETYAFLEEVGFSALHVFPYSKRANTKAAEMKKHVDENLKKERVQKLLLLSKTLHENYKKQFYGRKLLVLFETYDQKNKILKGHTSNYLLVKIKSEIDFTNRIREITYFDETKTTFAKSEI